MALRHETYRFTVREFERLGELVSSPPMPASS